MSRFIRTKFRDYDAYTPGEQPVDMKYIKLNTNESPYPPGKKVLNALSEKELEKLRLYPSPGQQKLRAKLAETFELIPENFCVSNGSDDIINFAFAAFCGNENRVAFPEISYGFYQVFSDYYECEKVMIPLKDDLSIDANDYLSLKGVNLIVIANPNAPTGLVLAKDEIELIVNSNPESVVLIDEAYVDFGGESVIPLTKKYDNLLVAKTFSKSSSLAGARLGYAVGNKELISDLELMKYSTNPYSVNRMTEAVGLAVLDEPDYYRKNCQRIKESRAWTKERLREKGIEYTDSKANFIFVKAGEGAYEALKKNGILVRWFSSDKLKDYIRVSIGTQEDMENFVDALVSYLEGNR